MPGFLYDYDGPGGKIVLDPRQHATQATGYVCSPTVLKSEKHDLTGSVLERCCDLAEIEIRGQHDPVFRQSLREDFTVRHPMQSFCAKMNGIVTLAAEPLRDPDVEAHVH